MKCLIKFKLFLVSSCTIFLLFGCSVHAPKSYDLNVKTINLKTKVIETPAIGKISTAELGDSLVFKQKYEALKGLILKDDYIITSTSKKREELKSKNICWMSKLTAGDYMAIYENSKYVFYAHTKYKSKPDLATISTIRCSNGEFAGFGFAQSKQSKENFQSWYYRLWNMNNDQSYLEDKIVLSPLVSEKGIFKQEFYYNGKIGSQLKFSYREFTEGGLARDSFKQDVIYDLKDSSIIGFKGAKFKVLSATNTMIKYKVISYFR